MMSVYLEWIKRVLIAKKINTNYFHDLEVFIKTTCDDHSNVAIIIDDRNNDAVVHAINSFLTSDKIQRVIHLGPALAPNQVMDGYSIAYKNFHLPYKIRGAYDYNKLVMQKGFWHAFRKQKRVIIFQHDVFLLRPWSDFDEVWLDFDYIGAEWDEKRPNGKNIVGGCGGFSIRNPKLHLSVCDRFSSNLWLGGEDGYFAHFISKLGGRVAKKDVCRRFCCQFDVVPGSFAIHKKSVN